MATAPHQRVVELLCALWPNRSRRLATTICRHEQRRLTSSIVSVYAERAPACCAESMYAARVMCPENIYMYDGQCGGTIEVHTRVRTLSANTRQPIYQARICWLFSQPSAQSHTSKAAPSSTWASSSSLGYIYIQWAFDRYSGPRFLDHLCAVCDYMCFLVCECVWLIINLPSAAT